MKIYIGKYYLALRVKDLCVGVGKPPMSLTMEADRSRRHGGI